MCVREGWTGTSHFVSEWVGEREREMVSLVWVWDVGRRDWGCCIAPLQQGGRIGDAVGCVDDRVSEGIKRGGKKIDVVVAMFQAVCVYVG